MTAHHLRPLPSYRPSLADLIDEFAHRYPSPAGRRNRVRLLTSLFAQLGTDDPARVTPAALTAWITDARANNTVRQRLSVCRVFWRWLVANGHATLNPVDDLSHLTRAYPTIYGKRQHKNPARFLTYEEAYVRLIGACQDGTWQGSRDQLAIRLGLLGMRVSEIRNLTWGALTPTGELQWIGKNRKARSANPGPVMLDLLDRWHRKYERELGRPVAPDDPIIVRCKPGDHRSVRPLVFPEPIKHSSTINDLLARRAAAAGLGHIAPHDLRRSTAHILHTTKTADGGHLYDLLDIQRVLDHSDPATTMRSYLMPMEQDTKRRAGQTLD